MSVPESLMKHVGNWRGTNRLWFSPEDAPFVSTSIASVTLAAQNTILNFSYTWEHDGKPCEGVLLLSQNPKQKTVRAVWTDSFHMRNDFLISQGSADDNGVSVLGSYAAPSGPDWGWRTVIDASRPDALTLRMFNIEPDGPEMLAVETVFERS